MVRDMNGKIIAPAGFNQWSRISIVENLALSLEISVRTDSLSCHVKPILTVNALGPRGFVVGVDAEVFSISSFRKDLRRFDQEPVTYSY